MRARARLLDRRRAEQFRVDRAPGGGAVFRHRGGRVRHRVLRQARQVRALPAATAISNNLEYDHADIYPDVASIRRQFNQLLRTVLPRAGWSSTARRGARHAVADGLLDAAREVRLPRGADWSAVRSRRRRREFTVLHRGVKAARSLVAARRAQRDECAGGDRRRAQSGVPPERAARGSRRVPRVKRRMEVRGVVGGVTVYDDFAHHPTAIATTLAGPARARAAMRASWRCSSRARTR